MADNLTLNSGSGGATLATDEDAGSIHYQKVKLTDGTANSTTMILAGGGVESGALRVTLASDSTGLISVDDNGGALTVDNGGTFAVQVDGSALTALQLIDDPIATDGAAAVAKLMQVGGTDGTNAQILSTNASGHVNIADGGNSITVDNGGTFAVQATCTNAGTFAVQVDGNALTALQLIDDTVFVDDAAFTPGTSKLLAVGFQADETATDSVDEGDIGTPRMTLNRQIRTVTGVTTAGGTSIFRSLDIDETEEAVKASAGQIYWIHAMNVSTGVRYLKFYNDTVANVVVGTTTPVLTFPIATQATTSGAGFVLAIPMGIPFDTAITVACTTGVADADTGAPGANDVIINVGFA